MPCNKCQYADNCTCQESLAKVPDFVAGIGYLDARDKEIYRAGFKACRELGAGKVALMHLHSLRASVNAAVESLEYIENITDLPE
jgi:primase-polymerase (primpol)-like protein